MQKGLPLKELVQEIQKVELAKRDFIAPTDSFFLNWHSSPFQLNGDTMPPGFYLELKQDEPLVFDISDLAHTHLADRLKIPKRYYDRMRFEAPELLSQSVNTWLDDTTERRMIRTVGTKVRAILSDKYRPLDNWIIARAAIPILATTAKIQIKSSQITEKRLYIQAVTPEICGEIRVGEPVQAGVVLSNSEVGEGSFRVEALLYFLACKNGAIFGHTLKRHHIGPRFSKDSEIPYQLDTIDADHQAFMFQVRDTLAAAFDRALFEENLNELRSATERNIPSGKVADTVQEVTRRYLTEAEGSDALELLISKGDLTQYGLGSAISELAHNRSINYDRVIELERIGGEVFGLNDKEWSRLTNGN